MVRYWWGLGWLPQQLIITFSCLFIMLVGTALYLIVAPHHLAHIMLFVISNGILMYSIGVKLCNDYIFMGPDIYIKNELDELIKSVETNFWVDVTVCCSFDDFSNMINDSDVLYKFNISSLLEKMMAYEYYILAHQDPDSRPSWIPEYCSIDDMLYRETFETKIASCFKCLPLSMAKWYLDILGFNDGTMSEGLREAIKTTVNVL